MKAKRKSKTLKLKFLSIIYIPNCLDFRWYIDLGKSNDNLPKKERRNVSCSSSSGRRIQIQSYRVFPIRLLFARVYGACNIVFCSLLFGMSHLKCRTLIEQTNESVCVQHSWTTNRRIIINLTYLLAHSPRASHLSCHQ